MEEWARCLPCLAKNLFACKKVMRFLGAEGIDSRKALNLTQKHRILNLKESRLRKRVRQAAPGEAETAGGWSMRRRELMVVKRNPLSASWSMQDGIAETVLA